MKKIIIAAASLLLAVSVFSQPVRGKFFLSGNLSLYMMKNKTKTSGITEENLISTNIMVLPGAGYFLGEKLAVGTYLGVNGSIAKDPNPGLGEPGKYTNMLFMISPFCRYYLFAGKLGMFAEATFESGFGKLKLEYEGGSYEYPQMSFSIGISPVIYYYISERIALEGKIGWMGYEHEIVSDEDENKDITNGFGIDLNPGGFIIGMTFAL
jgi:hypothetical protein